MYATSEMIDQMLADPETMIRTLKALQEERQQRKALEEKIAIDSPYTNLGKGISNNDNDILMRYGQDSDPKRYQHRTEQTL